MDEMNITLEDFFTGYPNTNKRFMELRIGKAEACCVKRTEGGLLYVMDCYNGDNVYTFMAGADYPVRKMTHEEESHVLKFAETALKGR